MDILIALFWGLATGIILGLLGGGGAMMIIPVLLYIFGYTLSQAVGASLFLVTLGALPAVLMYLRNNQVDFRTALPLGIAGAVGSHSGSLLHHSMPQEFLFLLLIMMITCSAYFMLFHPFPPEQPEMPAPTYSNKQFGLLAVFGFVIGMITGLVGVGGGFLLVPTLILLGQVPPRQAIATSLLLIVVNAMFGTFGYLFLLPFDDTIFKTLVFAVLIGSLIGFFLNLRVPQHILRKSFGCLLIGVIFLLLALPPR